MRFSRQEYWGFSGGPVVKNSPTRKHRFGSWSGKIPRAVEQLCPFTRTSEAWAPRAHAPEQKNHCTERPHTTRKSSPYWPQLEKSLCIAVKSLCTTSKRPHAEKKKGGFFFFWSAGYLVFVAKAPIYSGFFTSSERSLSTIWEFCLLGLKSSKCSPNKTEVSAFRRLPQWLIGKESACNAGAIGDVGLSPVLRRAPGGEQGNPFQCSCLRILCTEEPGELQSIRSQRDRHA